jgi:hypothetical protein
MHRFLNQSKDTRSQGNEGYLLRGVNIQIAELRLHDLLHRCMTACLHAVCTHATFRSVMRLATLSREQHAGELQKCALCRHETNYSSMDINYSVYSPDSRESPASTQPKLQAAKSLGHAASKWLHDSALLS